MKAPLAATLAVLTVAAWSLAEPDSPGETYTLRLQLADERTGESVSGLVRFTTADGVAVAPVRLLARGRGISTPSPIHDWYVVPGATSIELPRVPLRLTAFSGLETEYSEHLLPAPQAPVVELALKLRRFYDAHAAGWWNANTHVHLQKMSRGKADRYLVEVGMADGLDLVYVSYLERAEADVDYVTNQYARADLQALSNAHVHFDHGEEHRHNFTGQGEGYGHVMLLAIPELIYPVSIGPGISKTGTDGLPLQRGIDRAHDLGGTVIWCHNAWGLEDIPSWMAGRLEANNIFDGGTHGSYAHSFYRYLDVGIKVPFSTGTDWFIYDFSRVYVPARERPASEAWLDQLAAGRSYITNGPLLEFRVADNGVGEDVRLDSPGRVPVRGRAVGRVDFERIELLQSGDIVASATSRPEGGHFVAELTADLAIDQPCWLALRTPPPSVPGDPAFESRTPSNEYGRELFAHTSATFIDVAGRRIFRPAVAAELLEEMQRNRTFIRERGVFADEAELRQVLAVYDEGISLMRQRLTDIAADAADR